MRLYHFTCLDHGYKGIQRSREIRPNPAGNPMLPSWPPVIWLTDLPAPSKWDVGLTSERLTCDRLEIRYTVDVEALSFAEARRRWRIDLSTFIDLTSYGNPTHWWVTDEAIPWSAIIDHGLAKATA